MRPFQKRRIADRVGHIGDNGRTVHHVWLRWFGWLAAILAAIFSPSLIFAAEPVVPSDMSASLFLRAAGAEQTYTAPVLASDVFIEVVGGIARVTVRQRFRNPSKLWLAGTYIFPLPENSAVDRLRIRVGDRVIQGKILEKKEAKKVFQEAAKAGKRAALLSSARANVFSTSVANIGPGDEIVVEMEYQDIVLFKDGAYSYRFPLVVAPRFTPRENAPLVSKFAPFIGERSIQLKASVRHETIENISKRDIFGPVRNPNEGPINPVSIAVLLHGQQLPGSLAAANHEILIDGAGDQGTLVTLAEGSVVSDGDFVLSWKPKAGAGPAVSVFAEEVNGDSHLLVTVAPPEATAWPAGTLPRDLILVLDKSGSMHGKAMDQAKQATAKTLSRLSPQDRFNVVVFDKDARRLFRSARRVTPRNIRRALRSLKKVDANGGTNMVPALEQALASRPTEGRLRQIVFITDGAVSNEADLFRLIADKLGRNRLFTVGIGAAPNSHFMVRAAEMGRGGYTYINNPGEIDERIGALSRKLESPALTDLGLAPISAGTVLGEVFPSVLPDLYIGEPISFTLRLPGVALDELTGEIELSGILAGERWKQNIKLSEAKSAAGVAAIWARHKIADLNSESWRSGESKDSIRDGVIRTALRYQLVTRLTSLVAVDDEEIIRPDKAPLRLSEIERNLPRGMDFGKTQGVPALQNMLAPVPQSMMQQASFRRAIGLPVTATSAERMLIIGLLLLMLGLLGVCYLWISQHRAGATS
jgi:Ca-activated chloride channel family protein